MFACLSIFLLKTHYLKCDQFDFLEDELLQCSSLYSIMLCADLNTLTTANADFIVKDDQDDFN